MKSTLALSLCTLVTTGFAQEIARKVPAERPPVDPDRKVVMRIDPPKGPGLVYEPAPSAANATPPPVRTVPAPLPNFGACGTDSRE